MEFCECCNLPKGATCKTCGIRKSTDNYHPGKKYAKSVGRSTISKGIKHGKMLN